MMNALMLSLLLAACGPATKRLSSQEFDHYYALRVYMDADQKKAYLKMKTEEERNAYLKELGLWDRFYQYSEAEREQILSGRVEEGWSREWLYMAWGAPYDRSRVVGRNAQRSERLVYRFEQQEDGTVLVWEPGSKTAYKATRLFIREVMVDDDVVTEIKEETSNW